MICRLCPRDCGVDRAVTTGFCGAGEGVRVARASLHHWEEPVLSGTKGSGAVFFSGCTLRCSYCQNHAISAENFGKEISTARLREIFEELIAQGAHNINLVTATHYLPWILPALTPKLPVPVVYNCGGYEKVETVRALRNAVDVWLPDMKYADGDLAGELSAAPDYPAVAAAAIEAMVDQTGDYELDENGLLRRGVLIRHLVLPGQLDNTRRVIDWVSRRFRPGQVLFSLMAQYTPQPGAAGAMARHVTAAEYRAAVDYMENCGVTDGFTQERTSAKEEYTPPFDLTGV